MAAVLTRCAKTGTTVPTGIDSDMVVFGTLPSIPIPLSCPSCGSTHYWTTSTAWVDGERPRSLKKVAKTMGERSGQNGAHQNAKGIRSWQKPENASPSTLNYMKRLGAFGRNEAQKEET